MILSQKEQLNIIRDIKAGGEKRKSAFNTLYQKLNPYFLRKARAQFSTLTNVNMQEAQSAYNEAVMLTVHHIASGKFKQESSLTTYLARIFSNKCIDKTKAMSTIKRGKQVRHEDYIELPEKLQMDHVADPSRAMIGKEDAMRIKTQVLSLGEPCAQMLIDAFYYEFSNEGLSEKYGYKDATVAKVKKSNCLKKLKNHLGKTGWQA